MRLQEPYTILTHLTHGHETRFASCVIPSQSVHNKSNRNLSANTKHILLQDALKSALRVVYLIQIGNNH